MVWILARKCSKMHQFYHARPNIIPPFFPPQKPSVENSEDKFCMSTAEIQSDLMKSKCEVNTFLKRLL